jgi:hypothetical protein
LSLEYPFPDGLSASFIPPHCPRDACPSRRTRSPFLWRRKGRFHRACDERVVQRFLCCSCRRYFSTQTFRLDYRLHRPTLHFALFDTFISKVTQRQAARNLLCTRKTVVHRLRLLSGHARAFHGEVLLRAQREGGLPGRFQIDELETFENSRRLCPVTMPVLIERRSYFAVHFEVAPLPPRGKPHRNERERPKGSRRSGSNAAVERCFRVLADVRPKDKDVVVSSDFKPSYGGLLRKVLPGAHRHLRHSSKARRDRYNPLFPINHTLAMLRDGLSRLVRRSWGASKQRDWLERHAWIWIAYRNYIRGVTNRTPRKSPGQALGVIARQFSKNTLFEWRVFPAQ